MKLQFLFMLCCLCFIQASFSQNLVPNPGFESGTYNGGTEPLIYYSGTPSFGSTSSQKFEDDIDDWYVADPSAICLNCGPDSPDWIPGGMVIGDNFCVANNNYYVRSAHKNESIMVKLKNDYTLVKGETYRFSIKYRAAVGWNGGVGSFQVVFSTKKEGLEVQPHKKWVALDHYDNQSCEWKNYEGYFTVPTDNDKDYEDMKYMILQYNHEINQSADESNGGGIASLIWHYDDVTLRVANQCEQIKYIQDWRYENVHKIEQANQEIRAGAYVHPDPTVENEPVIIKSNSMVIYRAPNIYLEPGFFIEEPGSYFETQIGTCVADPCPGIPNFIPPQLLNCSTPIALGSDLPDIPGVFYSWEPSEYFSAPWSRETLFTPPTSNGCVNAQLIIWTICGAAQTFPFSVKYFDGQPTINVTNLSSNPNELSFELDLENTNSYNLQITNTSSGQIIYSENNVLDCNEANSGINIDFNQCDFELCSDLQVSILAENECFGTSSENFIWQGPVTNPSPTIQVSNLISSDFEYQFDLNVPAEYEYVKVELWNENMTSLICSNTYSYCNNPIGSNLHFDVTNCLTGCLSQCVNYRVKIVMKNFCNPTIASQTFQWNKSSTTFAMPTNYPNVITLNGDGINETLCFSPVAADYFYLVVTNQWGNVYYENEGCVTENPICLWTPPSNILDGTYFYIIRFGNQCGNEDELQNFVQVINGMNGMILNDDIEELEMNENIVVSDVDVNYENDLSGSMIDSEEVSVYPIPTYDGLNFQSVDNMRKILLLDSKGSQLCMYLPDSNFYSISMSEYSSGLYWVVIESENKNIVKKVIKD
jgi:hypothetical protein